MRQIFEVAAAQTSGLVNLVLSRQTVFFECEHPFIDKPMVITEPAVTSSQLLGLGLKLFLAICLACSTKTLVDSCRVFLE